MGVGGVLSTKIRYPSLQSMHGAPAFAIEAHEPSTSSRFHLCGTMDGDGAGAGGSGGDGGSVEMDLQALMMGSESLLTHIARPDGIPRLDKSLAEIVSAPSLRAAWHCRCPGVCSYVLCWPIDVPFAFVRVFGCCLRRRPKRGSKPPQANGHSFCFISKLNRSMFLLVCCQ